MDYGDSVQKVLLRKIQKAEQDLVQLKMDYCRFIFGITHRSRVSSEGKVYQVKSVDVDSMARNDDGSFGKPRVGGVSEDQDQDQASEPRDLGTDWTLIDASGQATAADH